MKPALQKLLFLALLLSQWVAAAAWDTTDPVTETDSVKTQTQINEALQAKMQQLALRSSTTLGLEKYETSISKTYKSFPELDQQLAVNDEFHIAYNQTFEPEFNATYMEENFTQSGRVDSLKSKAKQIIDKLKEFGNFVDVLTGNDLLQLPVGLSKRDPVSQNRITIAVSSVRFHSEYAELKLWAEMEIPQSSKKLYFGAEGVKFSRQGALVGDAKLVLLGDFPIPFNGDNWLLTLKGGDNPRTEAFESKSFLSIDCNGIKEISLDGNLKVSRNILLPINEDGTYKCDGTAADFPADKNSIKNSPCYVETDFLVQAKGWNDVLIEVTLPDFEMVGLKKWGFNVENAVLDLSDTRNSDNIVFPDAYNQLLPQGNQNLWRGVYAKEVKITLPESFKRITGNDERVRFAANDLLLDSFGLSGKFSATNILERGSAGKWAFSVDYIGLTLVTNSIQGGELKGNISVPIINDPLDYEGWIAENEYGLKVGLTGKEEFDAPAFLGKMTLEENSSVALKVKESNFYPSANLTGTITVAGGVNQKASDNTNSTTSERANGFEFEGIRFQELVLQTEPDKPYISADYFGFEGQFQLLFFPVTISGVQLATQGNDKAGLKFDMALHLDEKGRGAETSMSILGKLDDANKLHTWEFEKVTIDKIGVDFDRGGMRIQGELEILNDDAEFGDGFGGELIGTIKDIDLTVGGKGMFGAKPIEENSEEVFRYWFVDVWKEKAEGGNKSFLINSFMGGMSNRMRRVDGNSYWTPTGSKYTPDMELGLGLRAGVGIQTKGNTFRGKAMLELVFNAHGGLNQLGFAGEGAFMTPQNEGTPSTDIEGTDKFKSFQKMLDKFDKYIEENEEEFKQLIAYSNYGEVAKEAIPIHEVAASGKIGAFVGIQKDFVTGTFHGEFELYLSLKGLRGAGPSNKAGWAVLHSGPDEWYLHIGSPTDRLGLVFTVGAFELEVGGYFMTGDMLPTQLAPHPRIIQILGDDILDKNRRPNELTAGRGFALGLSFSIRKRFQYLIFYATLEVGAGFDVMHRYYPDARCQGRPGPVGNNGWYSSGNVYAWLYGEFGVGVKLLFIKKDIKIGEAGIAALLQGQFPNPSNFRGYVGMYFSVLGGLVKGRLRLKVEFGDEKCILENINPFTEVPIISDLTPQSGSDDVDVFTAPQAVFNYAIEQPFTIDTSEGQETFKINLKSFELKSEGKIIAGSLEWNSNSDAVTFIPEEVLPSKKEVIATVEVTFQERVNGNWQVIMQNGKPGVEKRESKFITDVAPDHIPLENIAFMYPVIGQQNFYPDEFDKGYVKLKRGQTYLFDGGYTIKAQINENGTAIRTNLGYNSADKMVNFDLPEMSTSTPMVLDIMAFPPGTNEPSEVVVIEETIAFDEEAGDTSWYDPANNTTTTEETAGSVTVANKKAANVTVANAEPKSLLNYNFKTSQHTTFKSKMRSLTIVNNITEIIKPDIHSIHLRLQRYENFDIPEVLGTKYTDNQSMVYGEAVLKDSYYKNQIYPLNYENYPLDGNITVNREENILGVPPIRGLEVPSWYSFYLREQPSSTYVTERYPLMYNLPFHYKSDFVHLQNSIINRYISVTTNEAMYEKYYYLIEGQFPALPLGEFKTDLIYRTPGGIHTDRYEIKFKND